MNKLVLKILVPSAASVFLMLSAAVAHEWMAPQKDAAVLNPLEKSSQVILAGQRIYFNFCMECHGKNARGLAPSVTGLERRPPDLQKTIKSHSDGDFFWKIKTGRGEMPSFKEELEDEKIWSVIHYIKTIK